MSVSVSLGAERVVNLNGGPIAYRDRGEGPCILFVHGLAVNGDLWRNVVPALVDAGYRCITPDWPLGAHSIAVSPTADLTTPGLAGMVAEFMERLELTDVTLVGNDTGGAICQLVATEHASRLRRLVLTSCDAFEVFPPEDFQYLKWIGKVPFALFLMANTMRLRFLRQTDLAFGRVMKQPPPVQVSDSYASPSYRSSAVRRDTARMLAGISNEHTLRAAASFAQCSMPVLIAWAAEDLLFPRALAERLTAAFPNSTLVLIPESRTFIAEDQPAALAAAILRFVRADGARVKGNP